MKQQQYVLLIHCKDEIGLIHAISNVLLLNKLNIIRNGEFVDEKKQEFFFRSEIEGDLDKNVVISNLKTALPEGAKIDLRKKRIKKIVVLGTKEHHCLGDLLIRNQYGTINAEIQGVICNHETLGNLAEKFEVPFVSISAKDLEREEHEKLIIEAINQFDFDYIVLAKYMRILTPTFVEKFSYRIINIHHSFLPSFIGANPYRQAFNRGVKLIGATAHFVTDDLDEGPIIYQDVIKVDHTFDPKAMSRAGKNVEREVLFQALELVFQDRVMVNGNKTIIF